jgi:hypothetical protein
MTQRQDMMIKMGGPIIKYDVDKNFKLVEVEIPGFPQWAWPGGYEMFFIMDDGETLCIKCANDDTNPVHFKDENNNADGWRVEGFSHTGETDGFIGCTHCGRIISDDDEPTERNGRG